MAFLPDTLGAVKAQSVTAAEIIIVDSENCPNTADLAKQYNASYGNIANNIAAKRNFGANKATADIVVFLDSDCLLPESWLAAASMFFKKADIIACGCSYFELPQNSHFLVHAWHQHQLAFQKQNTSWLPTSALAVRKSIFNEISGFNEKLAARENVDLGYRLNNHGQLTSLYQLSNALSQMHRCVEDLEKNYGERAMIRLHEAISNIRGAYTCLLYTSPSPRDKRQSRMPSSA